mgnify:FL=1
MKLFAGEAVAVPMTFDKFKEYHGTASVISMESMSTFLGQIQDIFQNSLKAFKSDKEERFIEDTLSDRYEVTAKVKDMRIMDILSLIHI